MAIVDGAGGIGLGGIGKPRDYGIQIVLPDIPIWLPDSAKQMINDLAIDTLRLAMQYAAGVIGGEAPVDSGQLAQSFTSDPATAKGGIELLGVDLVSGVTGRVFSALPHAIVMDLGRRAGQPISRAGIDAIGLWAQRKLGLSGDEAANAKWAIANAIVANGIEGTHYFETGVDRARPTIEQMFRALGDTVAAALVTKGGKRRIQNAGVFLARRAAKAKKG